MTASSRINSRTKLNRIDETRGNITVHEGDFLVIERNSDRQTHTHHIYTVVSEKRGTFACEIIMERYIYLCNTQKQLRITNYVRNKSFLEFYLVYNGVCLKILGSFL